MKEEREGRKVGGRKGQREERKELERNDLLSKRRMNNLKNIFVLKGIVTNGLNSTVKVFEFLLKTVFSPGSDFLFQKMRNIRKGKESYI